jgi:hypothetical protein
MAKKSAVTVRRIDVTPVGIEATSGGMKKPNGHTDLVSAGEESL